MAAAKNVEESIEILESTFEGSDDEKVPTVDEAFADMVGAHVRKMVAEKMGVLIHTLTSALQKKGIAGAVIEEAIAEVDKSLVPEALRAKQNEEMKHKRALTIAAKKEKSGERGKCNMLMRGGTQCGKSVAEGCPAGKYLCKPHLTQESKSPCQGVNKNGKGCSFKASEGIYCGRHGVVAKEPTASASPTPVVKVKYVYCPEASDSENKAFSIEAYGIVVKCPKDKVQEAIMNKSLFVLAGSWKDGKMGAITEESVRIAHNNGMTAAMPKKLVDEEVSLDVLE